MIESSKFWAFTSVPPPGIFLSLILYFYFFGLLLLLLLVLFSHIQNFSCRSDFILGGMSKNTIGLSSSWAHWE